MTSSAQEQETPWQSTGLAEGARRRVAEFTPADAAAVAAMFNNSEEGWPGGFTGGVLMTAEHVLREQSFKSLVDAAGKADAAFALSLETPMEDVEDNDSDAAKDLLKAVGEAHDAYRFYDGKWPRALPSLDRKSVV